MLENISNILNNFGKEFVNSREIKSFNIEKELMLDDELESVLSPETRTPTNKNGTWTGERGNSKFIPNEDYIPNSLMNSEYKTAKEILAPYNIDGIEYIDGQPDFEKAGVVKDSVRIDDFTEDRYHKGANFNQADAKLAEKWGTTPECIKEYREDNKLTWHETLHLSRNNDGTINNLMELVPTDVHGLFPHQGGISVMK